MDLVVVLMQQQLPMVLALMVNMDCMDVQLVQLFLVYAISHDDFETKPVNLFEMSEKKIIFKYGILENVWEIWVSARVRKPAEPNKMPPKSNAQQREKIRLKQLAWKLTIHLISEFNFQERTVNSIVYVIIKVINRYWRIINQLQIIRQS